MMMMWKAADFKKLIAEITIDFVGRLYLADIMVRKLYG